MKKNELFIKRNLTSRGLLKTIERRQSINVIKYSGGNLQAEDFMLFKQLPNLMEVDLGGSNITDDYLYFLSVNINIKYLNLDACSRITNNGIRHLECLKKLEYLNIVNTGLTIDCLSSIESMPSLRVLSVFMTGLSNCHIEKLIMCCPKLKKIGDNLGYFSLLNEA